MHKNTLLLFDNREFKWVLQKMHQETLWSTSELKWLSPVWSALNWWGQCQGSISWSQKQEEINQTWESGQPQSTSSKESTRKKKRGKKHPNNTQQNEGNPTALKGCEHCQKNRHMKDQCWKLHLELILRNKQGKEYLMTKNAHMLQAELAKIEDLRTPKALSFGVVA